MIWLTVPILLYWISRMWVKAHRGEMHDDPVLFALSDRHQPAVDRGLRRGDGRGSLPW